MISKEFTWMQHLPNRSSLSLQCKTSLVCDTIIIIVSAFTWPIFVFVGYQAAGLEITNAFERNLTRAINTSITRGHFSVNLVAAAVTSSLFLLIISVSVGVILNVIYILERLWRTTIVGWPRIEFNIRCPLCGYCVCSCSVNSSTNI
jgi:hypothetical protein